MKKSIGFPVLAALFFVLLLRYPSAAADAVREGMTLAFASAIPALFPFFIASTLLTESGLSAALGRLLASPMQALYGVSGNSAAAILLGLTGGYPVGAQTICTLYHTKQLSQTEAEYLLGFCNNTGPAFIVGMVGVGICGCFKTGLILYGIHAVSALFIGLLLPHKRSIAPSASSKTLLFSPISHLPACLVNAVQQALQTSLLVAAFIISASIFLSLLRITGIFALLQTVFPFSLFSLPASTAEPIFSGIIELTNGLLRLPHILLSKSQLLPLASFLLGFGGLSVHCQTLSLAQAAGLSCRIHFFGKLLHGILSGFITYCLSRFFPQTVPVFSTIHPLQSPSLPFLSVSLFCMIVVILLTFYAGKHLQNRL